MGLDTEETLTFYTRGTFPLVAISHTESILKHAGNEAVETSFALACGASAD
jgi:hypothetical protein